jgi:hypothetical protein
MTTNQNRPRYLNCLMMGLLLGGCVSSEMATENSVFDATNNARIAFDDSAANPGPSSKPLDLVVPQPERPHCATCSVDAGVASGGLHALYMTIAPETWALDMYVTDAVLYVYDSSEVVTSYTLDTDVVNQINLMDEEKIIKVMFSHSDPDAAALKFKFQSVSGTYTDSSLTPLSIW